MLLAATLHPWLHHIIRMLVKTSAADVGAWRCHSLETWGERCGSRLHASEGLSAILVLVLQRWCDGTVVVLLKGRVGLEARGGGSGSPPDGQVGVLAVQYGPRTEGISGLILVPAVDASPSGRRLDGCCSLGVVDRACCGVGARRARGGWSGEAAQKGSRQRRSDRSGSTGRRSNQPLLLKLRCGHGAEVIHARYRLRVGGGCGTRLSPEEGLLSRLPVAMAPPRVGELWTEIKCGKGYWEDVSEKGVRDDGKGSDYGLSAPGSKEEKTKEITRCRRRGSER